ncbi:dual specificity protein phosphatase 26 isoform X1 [Callorhinchus milii]|nr:dual specificity protein phosphatase 26 isoform X1 [Callorhinchus milii]
MNLRDFRPLRMGRNERQGRANCRPAQEHSPASYQPKRLRIADRLIFHQVRHSKATQNGDVNVQDTVQFSSKMAHAHTCSLYARGMIEDDSERQCTVYELQKLLFSAKMSRNHVDQVWPRLYIGDQDVASDRRELVKLGLTHVLNAVHSKWRGEAELYKDLNITYCGIEAQDCPLFDMSVHFYPAADFIHRALRDSGGKVLVHCAVGISRSSTLVLAYLMIHQRMTLESAIKAVMQHRGIVPNRGFLQQLLTLDKSLRRHRMA